MEDFEERLESELAKLPFVPHFDDGQYNDGYITGFEEGARWAENMNRSEFPDN